MTIEGSTLQAGTVSPGPGGGGIVPGEPGTTAGGTVFLMDEAELVFDGPEDSVVSGSIVGEIGDVGLTKNGAGTLTISGAIAISGGTTLNAGSLVLPTGTALTGTGPVTVQAGTLAGTGTVRGAISFNGGWIAPGGGVLSVGALSWGAGEALVLGLGAGRTASDGIVVTSGFTKAGAGPHRIELADLGVVPGGSYPLVRFGSTNFAVRDFEVTGIDGQLRLGADRLVFEVMGPPTGTPTVRVQVSRRNRVARFIVSNSGDAAAALRLSVGRVETIGGSGLGPGGGSRQRLVKRYFLDGTNVTRQIGRTRTVTTRTLQPGEAAVFEQRIVERRPVRNRRALRVTVTAINVADPSRMAQASGRIDLRGGVRRR